jgi:ectoine hydroxylase-related dioxygenase (phytanoyl-CoA dioxygenase family)
VLGEIAVLETIETTTPVSTESIGGAYARDGFVFPISVLPVPEARTLRADLEDAENELASRPDDLALLRSYPDRLLPSFDALIRNRNLIDAVSQILGEDLMVWSGALFIKEASSPHIVSWHQDLTYWGLDDVEEITAWVALSEASVESGCMRFVPGSHQLEAVAHNDTFDDKNLLSRGQEVAVDVDEEDAVSVVLRTGQASLHHGHLFHASGPNTTDDRRIGVAIRYIKPSMKQSGGERSLVSLVNGQDGHGNFKITGSPSGRMTERDFELCRADAKIKRKMLYAGAEAETGKRF